ncbi:uncharacterized protein HD556DRAFT_607739 [Suillus plorans]|uniref:Uncharacterized protein n=1 Tax=Suillus plorans TaxID=116603 RepID=A0A9P7J5K9_9AGAM|nr:uncharacterized protein HD556DRAFT_607739 [Suillus plorans]KAG1803771.1 hypothetical protein HD556DRAFT_607739 [Suillus plorans]
MTMLNINKLSIYVVLLSVAFAQILVVSAASIAGAEHRDVGSDDSVDGISECNPDDFVGQDLRASSNTLSLLKPKYSWRVES